jgi:porin
VRNLSALLVSVLSVAVLPASSLAEESPPAPPAPEEQVLLVDSFGRLVAVPASRVPKGLLPPPNIGLGKQVPAPVPGSQQPPEVEQRLDAGRQPGFELFPSAQPSLGSYLAAVDEQGNTAVSPGALVDVAPLESLVQQAKYRLNEGGFRYLLRQTMTYTGMSGATTGATTLGFYTLDLEAKWAVYADRSGGTAGWMSAQVAAKSGLGGAGTDESAQTNLGTLTSPTGIWSSHNGFRIPELAWQQSLRNGEIVFLAGVVDQGNYLDQNAYANTGRGQFKNSALIDTMVMPLPANAFGLNVQWQPRHDWYAMLGATAGNGEAGAAPWTDFTWGTWSVISEIGYAPDDFLGLGPGVYRLQPFVAGTGGVTQGGLCLNLQQQLGPTSPFGWFGRFGAGGPVVSAGASAQVGTGFVMQAPLARAGLVPALTNDLLGVAFVWSRPSATPGTVYHRNEHLVDAFYTLQLSPMMRLQSDVQIVWDAAFNPDPGPSLVAQFQWLLTW